MGCKQTVQNKSFGATKCLQKYFDNSISIPAEQYSIKENLCKRKVERKRKIEKKNIKGKKSERIRARRKQRKSKRKSLRNTF